MPAAECIPYKFPASAWTAKAKGAVTGKTCVKIGGDRTGGGGGGAEGATTVGAGLSTDVENLYQVETCKAKERPCGVAAYTAADKGELKVWSTTSGTILPIKAAEAITAGWELEVNATGEVIKAASTFATPVGYVVGQAMTKCGSGKDCEVKLF